MSDDFGEIRSLLHVDVSDREESWERLLTVMQRAYKKQPKVVAEEWLPYVLAGLEGWSNPWRFAPRKWVNAIKHGKDFGPLLQLVRGVDASRMRNPDFQKMCASPGFEWVRHLRFGEFDFKMASGKALGESVSFRGLTSLEFRWTTPGRNKCRAIFKNEFTKRLKSMTFMECAVHEQTIARVGSGLFPELESLVLESLSLYYFDWNTLSNMKLPSLKHLSFAATWFTAEELDAILAMPQIGQLEHLDLRRATYRYGVNVQTSAEVIEQVDVMERLLRAGMAPEVASLAVASISQDYTYTPMA